MSGSAAIEVTDLVRRYGEVVAVDGVSFEVGRGEVFGLLGRNGAGKTTTIESVCGLAAADSGDVRVLGYRHRGDGRAAYDTVGYVPQSISLYPLLSVAQNVELVARLHPGSDARSHVGEVIDRLDLGELARRRASELSGGEQRRVQLAMAMVHGPAVLVLDEPTANVDVTTHAAIVELIGDLGANGTSVLYTTHYLEEAERICDRVAIMDRGRFLATGSVTELITRHGVGAVEASLVTDISDQTLDALGSLPGVEGVDVAARTVRIRCGAPQSMLLPCIEVLQQAGSAVTGLSTIEPRLEGVFLQITGDVLMANSTEETTP